jgi:hypothetical protein
MLKLGIVVIPEFRKLRQEDYKLETSLGYIVRLQKRKKKQQNCVVICKAYYSFLLQNRNS